MLYSGNGLYKLLRRPANEKRISLHADPYLDRHAKKDKLPFWKGTAVGIDISLGATSEFTFLLDLIRDTYGQAVRERKRQRYKKPKFI